MTTSVIPRHVGVVVPAKDERQTLAACLLSLVDAARQVDVPVCVMVVLDDCSDGSADVVRDVAAAAKDVRIDHLEVTANSVGHARRAGMASLIARLGASGTWLATTDADSVVPPHWLSAQLHHAVRGAEVVAGTVTVDDWQDRPSGLRERAVRRYAHDPLHHGHVHGANLSFWAAAYLVAGGFPDQRHSEDVALVRSFRRNAQRIAWAIDLPVTTSARRNARAPEGFSSYLNTLESESS